MESKRQGQRLTASLSAVLIAASILGGCHLPAAGDNGSGYPPETGTPSPTPSTSKSLPSEEKLKDIVTIEILQVIFLIIISSTFFIYVTILM